MVVSPNIAHGSLLKAPVLFLWACLHRHLGPGEPRPRCRELDLAGVDQPAFARPQRPLPALAPRRVGEGGESLSECPKGLLENRKCIFQQVVGDDEWGQQADDVVMGAPLQVGRSALRRGRQRGPCCHRARVGLLARLVRDELDGRHRTDDSDVSHNGHVLDQAREPALEDLAKVLSTPDEVSRLDLRQGGQS